MRARVIFGLGLLVAGGAWVQAQQGPPTGAASEAVPAVQFRQEVNYVEVDAVVTDAQGNFVRDLRKEDFQVVEDGKPQNVTAFSLVDIPIATADRPLFAAAPILPDVSSNKEVFDGRLYVLLLDDLHTNPLRSQMVMKAARQFIEKHMADNDMAAVVHTSGRVDASQDFTRNKALLLRAVDKFIGRKLRSLTLERVDIINRQVDPSQNVSSTNPSGRIDDPNDLERGFNARNALLSIGSISGFLSGVRGRHKALLLFSEGIDYDTFDPFNSRYASAVMDEVREAIGAATRSNVSLYTVDPRGLTSLADETIELGGLPDGSNFNFGSALQSELLLAQNSLRTLADETGGFAAVNSNDFASAFDRIVRDNSSYYLLGYYPANDKRDGRQRKIQVKVNRPGAVVRARKAYVAPRGKAPNKPAPSGPNALSPQLRELMESPLPGSGLPFSVHAAAFKGVAPNATVTVSLVLDNTGLTFTEKDGMFENNVELTMVAVSTAGKSFPGERGSVAMKLRPQTHQAVLRNGFRIQSKLNVPPGQYQLRVGAREANGGRVGSVFVDLEVPDFQAKDQLVMSGLLLTSSASAGIPTASADQQFKDVLPLPPTTAREFGQDEALAVFTEVYDNVAAPNHAVDISTQVIADDGKVVFKTSEARTKSELQGGKGGYGHAAQVPLRELEPGLYVVRVEGVSRVSNVKPVKREVQFRVRRAASAPQAAPAAPAPPANR